MSKRNDKHLFATVVGTPAGSQPVAKSEGSAPAADPAGATTTDPAASASAAPAAAAATAEPTTTVEKFVDIMKGIKKSAEEKKVDISKAVAAEQFDMFQAMSDFLDFAMMNVSAISSDLKAFVESGGATGFMGEPVMKSLGGEEAAKMILEEGMSDEQFEKLLGIVEKKGAKMKGARLDKFKTLVKGLQDLLKDLETSVTKSEPAATTAAAAPAAAPVTGLTKEDLDAAISKALGAQKTEHDNVVKGLQDRIAKLETQPAAPAGEGSNATEEPAAAVNKNQGKKSLWSGVL